MSLSLQEKDATSISHQAIEMMGNYGVEPTPENYTVWYNYVKGHMVELNFYLDKALRARKPLTEEFLKKCFDSFCSKVQNSGQEELEDIVKNIFEQILPFSQLSSEFEQKLNESVGEITESKSIESIRAVVEKVARETQGMSKASQNLNQQLDSVTSELETLKKNFGEMEAEARTDPLTGLSNRRGLESRTKDEIAAVTKSKTGFSMLVIDIDFFKNFNDTFGHLIGDEVLKYTARSCTNIVRGNDFVARFGGEEFVILLPNTDLQSAERVAENVRAFFAKTELQRKTEPKKLGIITLSIGISLYRANDDFDSMFERADKALYQAKQSGRNRVLAES